VYSERLISKVYFPRLIVPFAAVGAALVDFVIAFAMLLVLMLWYGVTPGWSLLFAPVIFGVIVLAALSVGTLLAALNVAYRDFRYVIPFFVQVWMFATPTVYMQPDPNADGLLRALLVFNPMTGLIANFRAACLGGAIDWPQLAISLVVVVIALIASCLYFRRVEDRFADVI
jgi:lipopolysaccharide transport system permease protein